ncbi:Acyltransferase family protein [Microbacterium sp. Nx66]|uniref:acyltransferase family protein n=1 Tax=Microbacterium sp. Nx66 TaxID=2766784 RepID=UPI001656A82D|nr:acyltransferase [Microbacterium sp. Nx66]CAD5139420.1 Acyltransferase family protein [Microbacterium sp. Nx66]
MVIAAAPRLSTPAPAVSAPTGHRDTGIDVVRALCVLGVVLLHAVMVGVTVSESGPVFENASDGTGWIAPLSWLLQVMPLFFVIGGFSGLLAYRRLRDRGGSATAFVAGRVHRLLRPALFTIAAVGIALAVLTVVGVSPDLIAVAGFRYGQPLWFLGVFLLCQALLPAFVALHDRAPLRTIALLAAAAVAVDVLRATTGNDALGFLNLAFVWLTMQQLGFFLADGRVDALRPGVRVAIGTGSLGLLVALFLGGVYSPDLIANINPPTAALLLVGLIHTTLFSLYRDRIGRFSRHTPVAAFTAFVTRRTMTIYLWHMPVLLVMAGATALAAIVGGLSLPALDSVEWWAARPLWLVTALVLTALVAVRVDRFENHPSPTATDSRRRLVLGTAVGLTAVVLLLVLGTTVSTAALAVLLLVAALRLAGRSGSAVPAPAVVA